MIRQLFATLLAVLALNAFAAVDANQATRADLETVKGIGPGLSGKILDARKTGGFKNWDDLVERVGGIGPRSATKLSQGGLTVAGNGFDGASASPSAAKSGKAIGNRKDKAAGAPDATTPAKAGAKPAVRTGKAALSPN
ncbi:MAG: helix-hairpin-helix domain-containing protein [Rubrivivax sp.]